MTEAQALKTIKKNKKFLNKHQIDTIRGQILSGDINGALKGLNSIKEAKRLENERIRMYLQMKSAIINARKNSKINP